MNKGSGGMNLIFIGAMVAVFYFFLFRPQQKRAKEQKKFKESLKVKDKVITESGIHGIILEMTDSTVLISSEGTKLRIEKSKIVKSID